MHLYHHTCRSRNLVFLATFMGFSLVFNYCYFFSSSLPSTIPKVTSSNLRLPTSISTTWSSFWKPKSKFWNTFAPILYATSPKCTPPALTHKATAPPFFEGSRYDPTNHLEMSDEDILSLKRSHSLFMEILDFNTPKLEYVPGTKGIVTTAGGAYFPVLLVSLLMLRRTGSQLPVEIFILNDNEYEPLLCDSVFPLLNARCILLSPILSGSKRQFEIEGYQIKILSILFSTFQHVLFLDADDFPVSDPEVLFDSMPYKENGMVLWKDFWNPSFSPHFLNITSLPSSSLSDQATIEAGQILINRATHAKTLMVAAYYNIFGGYYYKLITQGGPGEGDKDTFLPAALVAGEKFYVVGTGPEYLGTRGNGAAVLQFDAAGAWACEARNKHGESSSEQGGLNNELKPSKRTEEKKEEEGEGRCEVPPLFIHASWPPKLNALHNTRNERQWGSEEHAVALFGEDVEKVAWGFMVEMSCEGEVISLPLQNERGLGGDKGVRGNEEGVRGKGNVRRSIKRALGLGLGLGKLEFLDWGEGNKSSTSVCEQTRRCFGNMFGEEYVFSDSEEKKNESFES